MPEQPQSRRSLVPMLLAAIGACLLGAVAGAAVGLNISQEATRQTGYRQGEEDGRKSGEMVGYVAGLQEGKTIAGRELRAEFDARWSREVSALKREQEKAHAAEMRGLRNGHVRSLASAKKECDGEAKALISVRSSERKAHAQEVGRLNGQIAKLGKIAEDRKRQVVELESEMADFRKRYNKNRSEHRDMNSELHDAREEGRAAGYAQGKDEGYKDGYRVGYGEGFKKGSHGKTGW